VEWIIDARTDQEAMELLAAYREVKDGRDSG